MTETVLLVGAGVMGRGYVDAAVAKGLRVVLLDEPQRRETYEPVVDRFLSPAGHTEEDWLYAALEAADRERPDGVVPFTEVHVLAAAWVQQRLGLPGPTLAAAQASRNKAVQRMLWANAGLEQPAFSVVSIRAEALDWSRGRYPVVVKPLRGAASIGVRLVRGEAELGADLDGRDLAAEVLLEEYVEAPEFSWEGLVERGTVVFGNYTGKVTTGAPEFVELRHVLPWPGVDRARLDPVMARLVAGIGVDSALVHLEFRDDGTRVVPMELAVRTPGDHIMELVCLAYRHDLFGSVIDLALGRPVPPVPAATRAAGVVYLPAPVPGRITAIDGVEAVTARPGVVRVGHKKAVGDVVGGLTSSADRVAHVLAVADTAGELAAELDEAGRLLAIRTSPPAEPVLDRTTSTMDGPTVLLCKWRGDVVRAFARVAGQLHVLVDEADQGRADFTDDLIAHVHAIHRVADIDSIEELTGVAVQLQVGGVRIDQVHSLTEDGQLAANHLRALLAGDTRGELVLAGARDKRMMKQLAGRAGLRVADWAPVLPAATDLDLVGFPAVIKPAYGFGTMNTVRVDDAAAAAAVVADLPASPRLRSSHLIMERFVAGRELHVDALWRDGKPLYFVISAYFAPRLEQLENPAAATLDGSRMLRREDHEDLYERMSELHAAVNDALRIDSGATHLEAFETPDGLVFSEIATRLGGGWIPDLLNAYLGRSVYDTIAAGLLRGDLPQPVPARPYLGALHVRPRRAGTITAMPAAAEVRATDGVVAFRVSKRPGDRFALDNAMDWCLLVVVGADSAAGFDATVQRLDRMLVITVE